MRIWDFRLIPYLPDPQFKGQLRELVLIMCQWRDKGKTNHLLINIVMDFTPRNLTSYFLMYRIEYRKRYGKDVDAKIVREFLEWGENAPAIYEPFKGWHCYEYLRVCMANLYEKHTFGIGKSRITDEEWKVLLDGYKNITGEEYAI